MLSLFLFIKYCVSSGEDNLGIKGGFISLIFSQSKYLKKQWFLISSIPLDPNLTGASVKKSYINFCASEEIVLSFGINKYFLKIFNFYTGYLGIITIKRRNSK